MKILNEMTGQEMFFLLAGPCVIEGEEMALKIAEHVSELTDKWGIPYVFKGSFKKANRSRLDSFTGIGDEKALKILAKIRKDFQIPVVTDIHSPEDAVMAAEYVDILQIPAFLCLCPFIKKLQNFFICFSVFCHFICSPTTQPHAMSVSRRYNFYFLPAFRKRKRTRRKRQRIPKLISCANCFSYPKLSHISRRIMF